MATDREHEFRFTAYSGDIPVGHGNTLEEAMEDADRRLSPEAKVTLIVRRLRSYPFTHVERIPIRQ